MKIETYKRKLQELQDKIKNTNPRYVNKIAEMKEDAKELRRKIKEMGEKEKSVSVTKKSAKTNVSTSMKKNKVKNPCKNEKEPEYDEEELRKENCELQNQLDKLYKQRGLNAIKISKMKSKILNSNLEDKSLLKESPIMPKSPGVPSVTYPNRVRETNDSYKKLIIFIKEFLDNQEKFIVKLQECIDKIDDTDDDTDRKKKFSSSKYENGKTKTAEEKRANDYYRCDKCGKSIAKGSQYICVSIHGTTSRPIPKKLYHGRQYHTTIHSNATYRYHIGCYEDI